MSKLIAYIHGYGAVGSGPVFPCRVDFYTANARFYKGVTPLQDTEAQFTALVTNTHDTENLHSLYMVEPTSSIVFKDKDRHKLLNFFRATKSHKWVQEWVGQPFSTGEHEDADELQFAILYWLVATRQPIAWSTNVV